MDLPFNSPFNPDWTHHLHKIFISTIVFFIALQDYNELVRLWDQNSVADRLQPQDEQHHSPSLPSPSLFTL